MSSTTSSNPPRNFNSKMVMFDTNALLDALMPMRPQSQEAYAAMQRCNGGGWLGLVAAQSLNDVYYILRKCIGAQDARSAVEALMELLVIAPLGAEECHAAASSDEPDFEDGLVRACAELNNVDFILTRDVAAFRASTVRAVTCAEYLELTA